jgi:hypothetical protein
MARQNAIARAEGYSFLRTPADVWSKVERGELVEIKGNGDYELAWVSFPVARPEVKLFLEQLGAEHRAACNAPLIVTSLTRPLTRQPANSSRLSVHPAGMAMDLRIPSDPACRRWLETRLLTLQAADLLEVIRERRPPHYHVGLFPTAYRQHVERELGLEAARLADGEHRERLRTARQIIEQLVQEDDTSGERSRPRWAMLLLFAPLSVLWWLPAARRSVTGAHAQWWYAFGESVVRGTPARRERRDDW